MKLAVLMFAILVAGSPPRAEAQTTQAETPTAVEEIYLFRSVPERAIDGETDFCRTTAPFTATGENLFSLWSISGDDASGRVTDVRRSRIGEMRACLAVSPNAPPRIYTIGTINGIPFRGSGDQYVAQQTPVVQSRVNRFLLEGLPAPYVGGLISSNTVRLTPPDTEGYVLSSISIVRLWKVPR